MAPALDLLNVPVRPDHIAAALLCTTCALAAPAAAQGTTDVTTLSSPAVRYTQEFSRIAGVHELRNGRVIVVDEIERVVRALGVDGTETRIGREGAGPGEYVLPTAILRLIGDTSMIRDAANNRFMVLDADASYLEFRSLTRQVTASNARGLPVPISAADGRGRLYGQAAPIIAAAGGRTRLADSAAVLRWARDGENADTIAWVPVQHRPGARAVRGMVVSPPGAGPPFSTRPEWTVARDGTVAIVYDDPYRVAFIAADGGRQMGQAIPWEPVRRSALHEAQWCEERERPRPWVTAGRGAGLSVAMRSTPCRPPASWPDRLPAFLPNASVFAPDGRLWVRRTVPADQGDRFDVIDRTGRVVRQVALPPRTRLVGFGAAAVYLARRDELDLEHLERYSLSR